MSPEQIIAEIRSDNGRAIHRSWAISLCDAYEALQRRYNELVPAALAPMPKDFAAMKAERDELRAKVDGLEKENAALSERTIGDDDVARFLAVAHRHKRTIGLPAGVTREDIRLALQSVFNDSVNAAIDAAMQKEQAGGV